MKKNVAIGILSIVCLIALLDSFWTRQQLSSLQSSPSQTQLSAKPSFSLLFEPTSPLVTNTTIYQQVKGTAAGYDNTTKELTIEGSGQLSKIKLPFDPKSNFSPPSFADLSGLTTFVGGDTIEIGFQYGATKEVTLTKFIVVEKGSGPLRKTSASEVFGTVVSYDTKTGVLILKDKEKTFTVPLLKVTGDTSKINTLKAGDNVTIATSGRDEKGNLVITKFTVQ